MQPQLTVQCGYGRQLGKQCSRHLRHTAKGIEDDGTVGVGMSQRLTSGRRTKENEIALTGDEFERVANRV